MNFISIEPKGTTRRRFVRSIAAGAGGIALASLLPSLPGPNQGGLAMASAQKSRYEKYLLAPDIKHYRDLQVFEIKGKDARDYDFAVQLAPVEAIPLMNESTTAANADRVRAYIGGDPENVKDIGTQIEITMGSEAETYIIDSAAVIYIPRNTAHAQRLAHKPAKPSFVLTLTLPPKYVEPPKPKK